MEKLLVQALKLVTELAPGVKEAAMVIKIIDFIRVAVPVAIDQYKDLAPILKDTIEVVRQTGELTDEQLAELDAFEAKIDAEFDEAALAALREDAAAKPA